MVSHISTTQPLFSFTTSHMSLVKISQLANQGFSFLGFFFNSFCSHFVCFGLQPVCDSDLLEYQPFHMAAQSL